MTRPACIKNLSEIEAIPYDRAGKDIAATVRDIGSATGTKLIGIDVTEIPPGKRSSYLHTHKSKEEFFYVLSGRCRIRIGEESHDLGPGDAVSRPAGTGIPHQFSNPFAEPCSVMMLGVMAGRGIEDEIVWPELKRVMVVGPEGERSVRKL